MNKEEFLDLKAKYTYKEISNLTGLTVRQISYKAKNWGLNFSNKKLLDTEFFSRENKKPYYWAGFIAADGYIEEDRARLGIGLAKKDIDHLYKFKKAIKSEHDICPFMSGQAYRIRFNSKKIVEDLRYKFNITGKKTHNYKLPIIEEDYLLWEFLRGYIDGDGHIEKTCSSKLKLHLCSALESTLLEINDIFSIALNRNINQIPKLQVNKKGSVYAICWTVQDSIDILNILYKNSSIETRLDRKFETYSSILG
jgi:hypothetical protein